MRAQFVSIMDDGKISSEKEKDGKMHMSTLGSGWMDGKLDIVP